MRPSAALLILVLASGAPVVANAQDAFRRTYREGYATRTELESLALKAERAADSESLPSSERKSNAAAAFVLRQRLRDGDFQPGDRIFVVLDTGARVSDTLVVRRERTIVFPDIPEISLAGVLRSELQTYLSRELGRYIREPNVQTRPLLRIAVSGGVARPGFYSLPADALLSDLVMVAGGPSANASYARSAIRRGGDEIWNGQNVETAISDGMTVDALLLRSGDEVVIGEKRQMNWQTVIQTTAAVLGVVSLLAAFRR